MKNILIEQIVSGGQTGADRAALDIAIKLEIPHGGWCPHERKAEDGVIHSKYNLKEAPKPTHEENLDPDAIYKKRTELNARDSDGTLIIVKDTPIDGTLYTIDMTKKYKRPYLIVNISSDYDIADIVDWIIKNNIHKLNIAGPRESQTSGIYDAVYNILHQLLNHNLPNKTLTEKQLPQAKL